jgi:hypothetical protein
MKNIGANFDKIFRFDKLYSFYVGTRTNSKFYLKPLKLSIQNATISDLD